MDLKSGSLPERDAGEHPELPILADLSPRVRGRIILAERSAETMTNMTTTLIYEPMASISDDYFQPPRADRSVGRRNDTDDRSAIETRKLALEIREGLVIGLTASLVRSEEQMAE